MTDNMKCIRADLCKKFYGVKTTDECTHQHSLECPIKDKIEDILMDTVPFYDPDEDLPEEDEEEP